MDFEYSDRSKELLEKLNKFMDEVIYPAEPVYEEQMEKAKDRWQLPAVLEECKAEAKKRGLWNMFLPADRDTRRHARHDGPLQPRICADLRSAGPLGDRLRGGQLLGARHRQHGSVRPLRLGRAQGEVAEAAAQRRDPLVLRHDRAGGGLVRRAQRRVPHRERRRQLRHQRPQVVVVGHGRSALQGHHPDGQERSQRAGLPPAVDDRRAARHAGHQDRQDAARVRL